MLSAVVPGWRHPEDHVRADRSDHPHVVGGDFVTSPLLERLVDAERVAEVDRAREVLLRAVEAMQCRELLRPQNAEGFEDLRSDFILSAVAASGRDEGGAVALAAIQHHEQPVVLVVRMRRRFHHDADVGEMAKREPERDMALLRVEWRDSHLRTRRDHRQREGGC